MPGEHKSRARPVCLPGDSRAVTERAVAEEIVRGWWRSAGGRAPGARLDLGWLLSVRATLEL